MESVMKISCECSQQHNLQPIKVISEELPEFKLINIMPMGIRVLFLSNNYSLKRKFSRFYRLVELSDINSIEGLDILSPNFNKEIHLPEDIRLVISQGEYIAFGKYLADKLGAKHIICGSGNLSSFEYIFDGVYKLKKLGGIDAIIKTEQDINLPSTFAFIFSTYLALFDWDISALLFGENICSFAFLQAQKTIKSLLSSLTQLPKRSLAIKNALLDASINISQIIESMGKNLLFSGASQAAAALSLLFKKEERQLLDFFDLCFLFSPTLAKIYAAFLESDNLFSFPANNSLHASKMHEYLGIGESLAYSLLSYDLDKTDIRLVEYRLKMYKKELLCHIYDVISVLEKAYPIYLRLYEDDGFFLKDYLSILDTSLSIGLGGSVLKGNTLLSYIRYKGLLDRYIL